MSQPSEFNWDAFVGNLMSGYLGYVAGSRKFSGWEPIIKNYDTRMSFLAYTKAIRPVTFFDVLPSAHIIYREAVLAYLFGLPDASIPTTLRCLEIGLSDKYTNITGEQPPRNEKLRTLIDWAEQYLGNRRDIAHGFRILRNLVHEQAILQEQDAIEAIRHITIILNLLYPLPPYAICNYSCEVCLVQSQLDVPIAKCYLGNVISTSCARCHRPTTILVI